MVIINGILELFYCAKFSISMNHIMLMRVNVPQRIAEASLSCGGFVF